MSSQDHTYLRKAPLTRLRQAPAQIRAGENGGSATETSLFLMKPIHLIQTIHPISGMLNAPRRPFVPAVI